MSNIEYRNKSKKEVTANQTSVAEENSMMAAAASKAARDNLEIHSPSRVFYGIGNYSGLGFINALKDAWSKAYIASEGMANSAKQGLSNGLEKIKGVINGDINLQPSIRPVMDLSDVQSGVGIINSMFGNNMLMGVTPRIDRINSVMSHNNQNGNNEALLDAVNHLRKDLRESQPAPSYTINGVTYDDGSNITSTIESLFKAAKVARRR